MIAFIAFIISIKSYADNVPLWLRYPAISPDGKSIVFSYKGDLYKVSASGGQAFPLTINEAYDFMPVWSHDGKWIAFASDRNGGRVAKTRSQRTSYDHPISQPEDSKRIRG